MVIKRLGPDTKIKETTGPPNLIMYQGIHHQPCQAPLAILEHISSHNKQGMKLYSVQKGNLSKVPETESIQ